MRHAAERHREFCSSVSRLCQGRETGDDRNGLYRTQPGMALWAMLADFPCVANRNTTMLEQSRMMNWRNLELRN